MKAETRIWAYESEGEYGPFATANNHRSLCPAVGEVVGHRLMQALGIPTAPSIEILETEEALHRDPLQWIFKPIRNSRLTAAMLQEERTGRWVLLVEKIRGAVPLSFLRKKFGIDCGRAEVTPVEGINQKPMPPAGSVVSRAEANEIRLTGNCRGLTRIIWEGKPELPTADAFYADFVPPEDWSAVKRAISWDSDPMLGIHAARLFLGISIAHASNVLVDSDGRLYSIDHESCSAIDGSDLVALFNGIKSGTRAFEALRGVAQLSEEKLRALFEDLPVPDGARWFRWPLGSKGKTVSYYLDRLRLWKLGFAKCGG